MLPTLSAVSSDSTSNVNLPSSDNYLTSFYLFDTLMAAAAAPTQDKLQHICILGKKETFCRIILLGAAGCRLQK